MPKFLILTDSIGNPRSFPVSDVTQLEETYPYMIRERFNSSTFWQLSYGNISTEQLIGQAIGYLNHWDPDVIIVQSGIIDCRPEAFTVVQKAIINKLLGPLSGRIQKYVYHPKLIKRRQVYRIPKRSFRKTLKKSKLIFSQSRIYWLEICAAPGYERARPGVNCRMADYNQIIASIYGEDFIKVQERILSVDGFNEDNFHWNKHGHKAVADILIDRINSHLNGE